MAQSKDDLSAEAERYVMPAHFVESDSLEVRDFVSKAIVSRWTRIRIVPVELPELKQHFACPRQSFLQLVCGPSVFPPLWGLRMCVTT